MFGVPASHVGVYSVTQLLYNAALLFCWLWPDLAAAKPNTTRCSKIAEAEAGVSVNEKKWLVMHVHVQMRLDELRGPPNPWLTVT
jgi:hypothetical protein